ncbi:MAG: hypothetical protein ACOWYE_17625 [Desulfatiglandales bacterium]
MENQTKTRPKRPETDYYDLEPYQFRFLKAEDPFLIAGSEFPNRFTVFKLRGLALGQGYDGWTGRELWEAYGKKVVPEWSKWDRARQRMYLRKHGLLREDIDDDS